MEEFTLSEAKIRRLRNLNYFKDWTDEQIIEHVKNRKKGEVPPPTPQDITDVIPASIREPVSLNFAQDDEEYKRKFNQYLNKYKKELDVDLNDANDAESLRAMVRYVIQAELINNVVLREQSKENPNTKVLKDLADVQRTLQQNLNEIQDRLGISRKTRKEKNEWNDVPEFVAKLKEKAINFWERKTVPITCHRCRIELARYWLNFPDTVIKKGDLEQVIPAKVNMEIYCDNCKEKVLYTS